MVDDEPQPSTLVESETRTAVGERDQGGPRDSQPPRKGLPARYRDLVRVGKGGSGEVRRVVDLRVDRSVVMKLLAWQHVDPPDTPARRRFENEARVPASLEHHGVVPVHDQGQLPDGRPWFTMKEVRGETFASAIDSITLAPPNERPAARRALVTALLRVAETVGYAHSRGVVHRDLKPTNLMRGAFGEVYVMDWGVAKDGVDPAQIAQALDAPPPRRSVVPADAPLLETGDRALTRQGDILGTVPYMAPEQARGWSDAVGPASDVWALGLVLYEILVGKRAYEGPRTRVWVEVASGRPVTLPSGAAVPDELRALVAASAREPFAARLRDGLAGEARRERARVVLREAEAAEGGLAQLREEEDAHLRVAERLLGPLHANDPDEARRQDGWEAEDRAAALRERIEDAEAGVLQLLRTALQHDPESAEAHARIATLALGEVVRAEGRGDGREAKRWERLLRQHDDGRHATFLAGKGEIVLDSAPVAASVTLYEFVEERRRLVEKPIAEGLRTPLRRSLPAGSYLAVLEAPERATVRYPFRIERGGSWESVPPDATEPRPVWLPEAGSMRPDECYVPAGWCTVGEPEARREAYLRTRVWVESYCMRRFVVTTSEYLAYLRALHRDGARAALEAARPRSASRGVATDFEIDSSAEGVRLREDTLDSPWLVGRTPVRYVTKAQAEAYATWLAERDELPIRLPTGVEWEKAARGVDERRFPWGRTAAGHWAATVDHDPPGVQAEDAAPYDESPYGVRHLAGNVIEWVSTPWRLRPQLDSRGRIVSYDSSEGRDLVAARGGRYSLDLLPGCLTQRMGGPADTSKSYTGFRLVRSLGPLAR